MQILLISTLVFIPWGNYGAKRKKKMLVNLKTEDKCLEALSIYGIGILKEIPQQLRTEKVLLAAAMKDSFAASFISQRGFRKPLVIPKHYFQ